MTCEQFVFWLAGYMSGGCDNDPDIIIEDITKALKEVINLTFSCGIYMGNDKQ